MNENPHKPAADPVFVSTHWTEFSPDGRMILTHSSDKIDFRIWRGLLDPV